MEKETTWRTRDDHEEKIAEDESEGSLEVSDRS